MLNVTLIVSKDSEVRKRFSEMLQKIGVPFIFESDVAQAILRILEIKFKLTIIDLESMDCNQTDFLKVIQLLRPKLPVFAIIDETMIDSYQQFLDAGAKYCLIKTTQDDELAMTIQEILSDTKVTSSDGFDREKRGKRE